MGDLRTGRVSATRCRCNCGYTCGGPGICQVFSADMQKCLTDHFRKDCDHVWDGPMKDVPMHGGECESKTCLHCGMAAVHHDMAVGP